VEQDLVEASEWMRKAADKNVGWAKNELFDILWKRGSEEDLKDALALISVHAMEGKDAGSMARLAQMYKNGKGVKKDIFTSIKFIEEATKMDFRWRYQLMMTLLESSTNENGKRAFELCQEWSEEDERFKEMLIRMYWHGIGTERNRKTARRLIQEFEAFRKKYIIQPVRYFTKEIFSFQNIVIWNSVKNGNPIICSCLQNNLDVKYIINESKEQEDYLTPSFLNSINAEEISKLRNCAIIIEHSDFLCEREKKTFPDDVVFFIFSLKNEKYEGTNNLFVQNPQCQDIFILGDENRHDFALKLEKEGVTVKGTLTFSGLKERCSQKEGGDIKLLVAFKDIPKLKSIGAGINDDNIFMDYENDFSMKSDVLHGKGHRLESLFNLCFNYEVGKKIYEQIENDSNDVYLLISDIALGDHYRYMCKANQYSEKYHVKAKVIVGESAKDLLDLFQYEGIVLKIIDKFALGAYLMLSMEENEKIFYLDQCFGTSLSRLSIPNGSPDGFADPSSTLLGIPLSQYDPIYYPKIKINLPLDEYNNSVLINPYGNWIMKNSPDKIQSYDLLFRKIVHKLNSKGVTVYTNSINDTQPALPDTIVFRHTITDLTSVCRQFKHIVTIFTGFMEAMILTECNLSVISPDDGVSRKQMAKASGHVNYWEYYLDRNDLERLADEIVDNIMQTTHIPTDNDRSGNFYDHRETFDTTKILLQIGMEAPIYSNAIIKRLFDGKGEETVRRLG